MKARPILYAEDEEADILFMRRALSLAQVPNPLITVADGELATEYLTSVAAGEAERPCLILLDLNMPLKTGLEVLKWIRSQPLIRNIPVVVLSSSDQERDIRRAYDQFVNGYLVKPGDPKELLAMVKAVKEYWLTYNKCL